jgi:hypothetical protein
VHHQPWRLVDHYEIRVLVDDLEVDCLGLEATDVGRRRGLDRAPGTNPITGPGRRPIDEHPLIDQGTGSGPAQVEKVGQHLVDAIPFQARRNF